MSAPVLNGPFVLPMFRSFVPRKMQPWIYLFIAVTFQLSGGVYLGALNQMIGSMSLMREDILMCIYANLAGMAIYFPLLFRMKFRFTNKTLLTSAALGVLLCNLIAPHITFLPLLWLVCFIEGMCKIQGTFECMSNIQLWMTPKRDFTVFLSLASYCYFGKHPAIRPDYDPFDVSLSLDIHEPVRCRSDADCLIDTVHLCEAFPVHAQISSVWYRLAGRDTMGCLISGNRLPLQLRRLVRLVEQPGHPPTYHRDFHHFRNLYLAHDDHSTPISRTKDVDVPPFFAFIGISHFSGSVPRHGARAGGSLLRGSNEI